MNKRILLLCSPCRYLDPELGAAALFEEAQIEINGTSVNHGDKHHLLYQSLNKAFAAKSVKKTVYGNDLEFFTAKDAVGVEQLAGGTETTESAVLAAGQALICSPTYNVIETKLMQFGFEGVCCLIRASACHA